MTPTTEARIARVRFPDSYLVYDFETTDKDPRLCEPIELAYQFIKNGVIEAQKEILMKPSIPLPAIITEITGLRDRDLVTARKPEDVLNEFYQTWCNLGRPTLVGHNITTYDNVILDRYWKDSEFTPDKNTSWVDTAALFKARAMNMVQRFNETHMQFCERILNMKAIGVKYNLALAVEIMGVETSDLPDAHRAMADVIRTERLYKALTSGCECYKKNVRK